MIAWTRDQSATQRVPWIPVWHSSAGALLADRTCVTLYLTRTALTLKNLRPITTFDELCDAGWLVLDILAPDEALATLCALREAWACHVQLVALAEVTGAAFLASVQALAEAGP